MSETIDVDALWKKYQGQNFTIPPYRGGSVDPGTPDPEPSPQISTLTGYRYDASDSAGHVGEYYFIPPAEFQGRVKSVVIGDVSYSYEKEYRGSEIWYGRPSTGVITVTLKDGSIYRSQPVTEPSGNQIPLKFRGNTNGNRPTYFTMDGKRMKVGQKVSFRVGPVQKSFVAGVRRNSSIGKDWSDGTVVKNSDTAARGIAVLIPSRYAGQSFPPGECWVEV